MIVTVAPLTLHTPVVLLVKVTGFPEAPPVALTENVPLGEYVTGPGLAAKVMVCDSDDTVSTNAFDAAETL
jgi:hypothetical protein